MVVVVEEGLKVAVAQSPVENYSLSLSLFRSLNHSFSFALVGGQREAGCSSDVRYHPVSWTRLHTGTGEPVPLPLLFSSALLEPAQEHPKVALNFYRTKTVIALCHYKTGVHHGMHVAHVRIVFFELAAG